MRMNATNEHGRPHYGWYGDDFTGATDTLATWAERGYRALLFLREPKAEHLAAVGPLDVIGMAGATRSLSPAVAMAELDMAGRFFAEQRVELLHYKCCSTFDSAPHVGSIGAAVRVLKRYFPNPLVPIVGGQPNLDRYCLFGTLFAAAGTGDAVHRIDRHPTMSVHPVTPMAEADLREHLAAQGLEPVGLLDYRSYEGGRASTSLEACLMGRPDAVLLDVARAADLPIIGRLIEDGLKHGSMLAVGPSSVAQALAAASEDHEKSFTPADVGAQSSGPVLALVGSLSPVTRAQVDAAAGYERIDIHPHRLDEPGYVGTICRRALQLISARNVMLVTDFPQRSPTQTEQVAIATGNLLRVIMSDARVSRIIVAGGDTSSHAMAALAIWGLSYRASLAPGVPLCRVHSEDPRLDGLDIVLKGGQMGPPSFFVVDS
jgi:3-oxoisoapionate kinase